MKGYRYVALYLQFPLPLIEGHCGRREIFVFVRGCLLRLLMTVSQGQGEKLDDFVLFVQFAQGGLISLLVDRSSSVKNKFE